MKRNDFLEIKKMDLTALVEKTRQTKSDIANLELDKSLNKLKDVKSISKKRKELAKMLTVLRQKTLLEEMGVGDAS